MKKEISIRTIDDDGLWDELVNDSPQGTVFCRSAWLSAVAAVQGGRMVRLGAWYDGVLAAGVTFLEVTRGGFRKAVPPMLTPYGGMLYRGDEVTGDTGSVSLLLAEQLIARLERRYHQITLAHSPAFHDVRPFAWQEWETKVRYTYRLDITDPDAALKRYRKRVRSLMNRAARNLTVRPLAEAAVVGEIHEQTFRRQHTPPPFSGTRFAALVERLGACGLAEVTAAVDHDGGIAGVLVIARGRETVYTMFYGTDENHQNTGVDSFLIRDAVERYAPTHQTLDLAGANIPSIAFFKRGFGGRLTPYYVTERFSSPIVRGIFAAHTRFRKLVHR